MSQLIQSFYKNVQTICMTNNEGQLIKYLSHDGLNLLKQVLHADNHTTLNPILCHDFGLFLVNLISICSNHITDEDAEIALQNLPSINSIFSKDEIEKNKYEISNIFETLDYIFDTIVHLFHFHSNHSDSNPTTTTTTTTTPSINVSLSEIQKTHIEIAKSFVNLTLPTLTNEAKIIWFYEKKLRSVLLIFQQILSFQPSSYTTHFSSNPIGSIITLLYNYLPTQTTSNQYLSQLTFDSLQGFALLIEQTLCHLSEITSCQRRVTIDLLTLINQFLLSDYFSLFHLFNCDRQNEIELKTLLECCSSIFKRLKIYRSEVTQRKQHRRFIPTYSLDSYEQACMLHRHQSLFEITITNKNTFEGTIVIKNDNDDNQQIKRICVISGIYDKLLRLIIKQFDCTQPSFDFIYDCLSYLISYGSCSCYSLAHYRPLLSKINHLLKSDEKIIRSIEQQSIQLLRQAFLLISNCSQRNHHHHHHVADNQIADNSLFWSYLSHSLFQRGTNYALKLARSFPDIIQCCSTNDKQYALKLCINTSLEYFRSNVTAQNSTNIQMIECLIRTLPNLLFDIVIDTPFTSLADTLISLALLFPTLLIHTLPVLGCLLTSTSDCLNLNISEPFLQLIIKLTNAWSIENDGIDNLCNILIILLQKCPAFRVKFYGHLCHLHLYEQFQLMLNNKSTIHSSIIASTLVSISYHTKPNDSRFNYKLVLEQITLFSERNRFNQSWFELLVRLSLSQQYQDKRTRWKSSAINKTHLSNESDEDALSSSSSVTSLSSINNYEIENFDDIHDDDEVYYADVESVSDETPVETIAKQNQTSYSKLILFPELVILGLEIVWQNVDNEWSDHQNTMKTSTYITNLVTYLEFLSALVRANSYNCVILKKLNIDGYLFTCLTKIVPRPSFIQKDILISLIITLLQFLWSQSLTVNQLDQCFKLILTHPSLVGPLLRLFKHLVQQIDSNQPRSYCSMPLSSVVTSKAGSNLHLTLDQLLSLKYPQIESEITPSTNIRHIAIVTETLKNVQLHFPLTIAIWLRVNYPFDKGELNDEKTTDENDDSTKKDQGLLLHVLTLQHDGLQLQFWLDSKTYLCLKIVQFTSPSNQQQLVEHHLRLINLPRAAWSHIFITLSKTTQKVYVCLNGQTASAKNHSLQTLHSTNSTKPWSISLGQQSLDSFTAFYYDLGSILIFDKTDLFTGADNDYIPTYLYSLGSDHWHFLTGASQQQLIVNNWIYQRFARVHPLMSIDQFENEQKSCLTTLKRSLIASYTSNNPWTLFLFNINPEPIEEVQPSRLGKILPFRTTTISSSAAAASASAAMIGSSSITSMDDGVLLTTTTISLPSRISLEQSSNILNICEQLGGILNFIYLFAKIIEINPFQTSSSCISHISDIIFSSIWKIKSYYNLFKSLDGYHLIVKILTTNECTHHITNEFYEVLIDKCIVLNQQRLYDINLFHFILLDWKIWYNHSKTYYLVIKMLNDLLSDQSNPKYFLVNRQLFKTHFTLEHFLTLCQELIDEQKQIVMTDDLTKLLVNIIEALTETDLNVIALLMNFVLLIHPLVQTYVNYNKEQFYFIAKSLDYYRKIEKLPEKKPVTRKRSTTMIKTDSEQLESSARRSHSFSDLLSSSITISNEAEHHRTSTSLTTSKTFPIESHTLGNKDSPHNIDYLSTGILKLLGNIALTASDRLMTKLVDHVFRLNILIVLLLDSSIAKRVQSIRLLNIILTRMDREQIQKEVLQADLHTMFANQIYHQLNGDENEKDLLEICVSIALQRPIEFDMKLKLSEQIHDPQQYFAIVSSSPPCLRSQVGFALILSFVEKFSIHNRPLCELILDLLGEIIYRSNDENRHFLIDIGLTQVLFNTLSSAISTADETIIVVVQKCLNSLIVAMFMTTINDGEISFLSIFDNLIGMMMMIDYNNLDQDSAKYTKQILHQTFSNMFNSIIDSIDKPISYEAPTVISRSPTDDQALNSHLIENHDRFKKFLQLALDYIYSFHYECQYFETLTLRLLDICLLGSAYLVEKRTNHLTSRHQLSLIMHRCGDIIKQISQKLLIIALEPDQQRFFFRIQVLKHIIDQPNAKAILGYLFLHDNQCYIYHHILIYLQILSRTTLNENECEQLSGQSASEQSRKSTDSGNATTIKQDQSITDGGESPSSTDTVNISARRNSKTNKTERQNSMKNEFQPKDATLTPDDDEYIEVRRLSNSSAVDDERENHSRKISERSSSPSSLISSLSSELMLSQQSSFIDCQHTIHLFRDLVRSVKIESSKTNDSQVIQRRKLTTYLLTPASSTGQISRGLSRLDSQRHSFDWPKSDSTTELPAKKKTSTFRQRRSDMPAAPQPPVNINLSDMAELKYQEYTTTLKQLIEATQKRLLSTYKNSLNAFTNHTVSTITARAMDITQEVIGFQGHERKKYLEHLRTSQSLDLHTKHFWHQLIGQLTHEYGVWFESASYPKFWELDPTENPQRERRRLQRSYCLMEKRFFQPQVPAEVLVSPPLSYLFGTRHYQSLNIQTVLHRNERIEFQCRCTNVTPNNEIKGDLLVGTSRIYFVADEQVTPMNKSKTASSAMTSFAYNYHSCNDDSNSFSFSINDICEMYKRRYLLNDLAVELFFINGITLMIAHVSSNERDNLYRLLEKRNILLGKQERVNDMQTLWKQGYMTNFEYLMQLNKLAGRTFLDLMQYPVYPYVVANYENSVLDLRLPSNYRNLAKPIAIQHPEKEEKFVDNYHALEDTRAIELARQQDGDQQQMASIFGPQTDPYHFASLYSNSGIVLHYLVRLLPFTRMFLDYQDNNFDCADRTFHDTKTSFWLSSFESTSDFKEIIPEFYYLHEFLLNKQGFNFGKRQNGEPVSDVSVAPWSKRNARLFVCGLRQALESDYVTLRLHQWIDLIFGYKQTGKAALDAINVYHAACYYGFPIDAIEDQVTQKAYYGIIRTYGQVPKQLFSQPHPPAVIASSSSILQTVGNDKRQSERTIFESRLPENSIHRQIINVNWGDFVGSYDMPSPEYISTHECGIHITSFVVRNSGSCIICLPLSSLVIYNEYILNESTGEQVNVAPSNSTTTTQLDTMIALKWNTSDGIVRCRQLKQLKTWYNFLVSIDDQDKITCCTSIDYRLLFLGKKSGLIEIYRIKQSKTQPAGIELIDRYLPFIAHRSPITCLHINRQFSLLISASSDGMITLWDTNRLSYVRTYKKDNQTIYHLTSSDITGDIAYLSSSGGQWHLSYLTCNCDLISYLTFSEQLNCLCFTSAPEGAAVNVLLGGFEDGKISMWSTWDLTLLRQLEFTQLRDSPITAICVSKVDRRRLYVADRERRLHLIESRVPSSTSPSQAPQILFVN